MELPGIARAVERFNRWFGYWQEYSQTGGYHCRYGEGWADPRGRRQGRWVKWYLALLPTEENGGEAEIACTYRHGQLHGPYCEYWPNGSKREEGAYRFGERHGHWTFWWENGQLWKEGRYRKGLEVGYLRLFDDQGNLRAEGRLRKGNPVGPWCHYTCEPGPPRGYLLESEIQELEEEMREEFEALEILRLEIERRDLRLVPPAEEPEG